MEIKLKITPEIAKKIKQLKVSDYDEYGREIPNPVPMYESIDIDKPPTLQERISRCLHQEFSKQAYMQGFESADEAEDFDIDESFDAPLPVSPHEMVEQFEPETPITTEVTEGSEPVPEPEQPAEVAPDPEAGSSEKT